MKVFPFAALLCLALAAQLVTAEASLDDIYQARVPISDRTNSARQAAYREGLSQILIKLSGYSGTPNFKGLEAELSSAEQYLLEFSIEPISEPADDGVAAQEGEALWMRFNQNYIDELVRRWEIPIWPSSRPEVGFAMQVVMGSENILLSESNYPAAAALLKQNALRRGVHLRMLSPQEGGQLLAQGQTAVDSDYDYWGLVELRRDRFGDSLATLKIETANGPLLTYEASHASIERSIAEVFDQFVDEISLQSSFVAVAASGNQVTLELSGIDSFDAYRRVLSSLESLEMVEEATVLQLDLDRVQVRVKLASGLALLLDGIQQQGLLQIEQDSTLQSAGFPVLQLAYQPSGN